MMRAKTEQKVKRWKDQRWLIDSVIQAVGPSRTPVEGNPRAGRRVSVFASTEELAMDAIAHRMSPETSELFSRALGEAVVRIWGHLPNALQSRLFEEAVTSHDGELRPQLAVFLHDKHPRTTAARKARAILEPDSLGG